MAKTKIKSRIMATVLSVGMAVTAVTAPGFVKPVESSAANIDANYAKALQYSLYFYDANMCGTEVGERSALTWRDDCHTYDANISTPYGTLDLSGGYHDAGDHVKFGLPQAFSGVTLGWSYYEFKDAYTSTGQAGHAKIVADQFAEYFRKCTVMENGKVKAFCYQVGDGGEDHAYWGSPEAQPGPRQALFATSSNPCTDIVGLSAASLAANYVNFGNTEDLTYAKALYEFAKTNNKAVGSEGIGDFYISKSWEDDIAFAAAWLYKATGDSQYKSDVDEYRNIVKAASGNPYWDETMNSWSYCWNGVWPGVNALMGEWSLVQQNLEKAQGSNYVFLDGWGSARYNTELQMLGLVYDKHNGTDKYSSWAKGQMDYLLGNNSQNKCYVVGYNQYSVKYPHHRASSGTSDANDTSPQKYVLVGALASGPEDASGSHNDVTSNYQGNEVALDYNAAFVGACAGLYLKFGSGQSVDSTIVGVKSTSPVVTETTTQETTTPVVTTTEPEVTTAPATTTKPVTTTQAPVTTPAVTTPSGDNKLEVNKDLDRDSENGKTVEVKVKDLISSPNDKIDKILVEVEANGNIGNFQGGYGVSVQDGFTGASTANWYQSDNFSQTINGNSGTIVIDISDELSDYISYDGNFVFGMWWSDQQIVTVKSIQAVVKEGEVTTTAPVTTTEAPVTTTEAPVTTTEAIETTTPVTTTESVVTTTAAPVTTPVETTTTAPVTTPAETIDNTKVLYGDVNLDGVINISDVILLNRHLVGSATLNATKRENANCVYDSKIDVNDSFMIMRFISKIVASGDLGKK